MVKKVVFINTDKTDKLTASNVLTMANFASDEFATSDNWNALQSKMAIKMSADDFANVVQSAVLVDSDIPATDAAINTQFNTTNVNGGKCYVVAFGGILTRNPQVSAEDYAAKVSKPYNKAVRR